MRTDTLDLPHKLHSVVCGKKRYYLQSISKETATNIYLPSVFLSMANNDRMAAAEKPATIHITGDSVGIARAKDMLTKLSLQKVGMVSQTLGFLAFLDCCCYYASHSFPLSNFGNQKTTIGKFYVSQGLYPASEEN